MKSLYNFADVCLHVYRHSSWGLGIHQAAACGSIPVIGRFCPSTDMKVGYCLTPKKEINISDKLPELVNEWGLYNAYGPFNYDEEPRFYDYDIEEYAGILTDLYINKDFKAQKNNYRDIINADFSLKGCAQNLVTALG